MAHVYVPYNSVQELVEQFQVLNSIRDAALPDDTYQKPNFVLVDRNHYFGSYGGLIYKNILDHYRLELHTSHSLSDDIGFGVCIVWWNTTKPDFVGDQYALAAEGREAVTPRMVQSMKVNTLCQKKPPKSNYYGDKPWSINAASFSSSDSE
ncbi:uncharacterized protein TNIN_321841 [Trichonephila inaurata madagascariensis]|uniref:Uncharacterized protein n=1 Tax=Trichonephila inaurata madagascariensis TaxID=2747483 RepID=A0A8X6XL49_9ARAC|nr:uncharacterized protein TNIN_321841 [Trichonephila inaurata madagascariensis]